MQVLSNATVVAAGTNSGNVLLGSIFEFLKRPSKVEVAFVATGIAAITDITARFSVGDTIVTDPPIPVSIEALAQRGVIIPDDIKIATVGLPGDRLSLEFTNTTAGPLTVTWWVRIS